MTLSIVQYSVHILPPSMINTNEERVFFEDVLKKWTPKTTPTKTQQRKKWMTQKEVADTYNLRVRTLEQLRRQGKGFPTKEIKGVIYYNRQAIEKHYALIRFQASQEEVPFPCTLNAWVDLSHRQKKRRMRS